jgi:RNA methyltransferase, TrmH family
VKDGSLIARFGRARRDKALAVLEGLHAVKHAMRFGAEIQVAVTDDAAQLRGLAERLAPDIAPGLAAIVTQVEPDLFAALTPMPPPTGVVAIAARRAYDPAAILAGEPAAPVVVLENPRDLGNVGACIRVAAAADAAGLISVGGHDLWHPDALRGAAGLHYALPVARVAELPDARRPLLALDPEGEELDPRTLHPRSVLAFGTERDGLSPELLARAERRLAIPMRAGVSSLNLATSVAAVVFAWRLSHRR